LRPGCAGSKPEPDPFINNSKHGNQAQAIAVKTEPELPDFHVGEHFKVKTLQNTAAQQQGLMGVLVGLPASP
jgi:hypothetical protein